MNILLDNLKHGAHDPEKALNAIIGLSELIRITDDKEQINLLVDSISNEARQIESIFNDVSLAKKLIENKISIQKNSFDLKSMLKEICKELILHAKGRGVHFLFKMDSSISEKIEGDAVILKQVIRNLCYLSIIKSKEEEVDLFVKAIEKSDHHMKITFEISTTASLYNKEKIDSITELLEVQSKDFNQISKELDFGTTLAARLIHEMKSRLKVSSNDNKNTIYSFNMLFPYEIAPENDNDFATLEELDEVKKANFDGKVLLCDNYPAHRKLIERTLKGFGFTCNNAFNSDEALSSCMTENYEIIMLDYATLGQKLADTIELLREMPLYKNKLIICLDNRYNREIELKLLKMGADEFLVKPIRKGRLISILNHYLAE